MPPRSMRDPARQPHRRARPGRARSRRSPRSGPGDPDNAGPVRGHRGEVAVVARGLQRAQHGRVVATRRSRATPRPPARSRRRSLRRHDGPGAARGVEPADLTRRPEAAPACPRDRRPRSGPAAGEVARPAEHHDLDGRAHGAKARLGPGAGIGAGAPCPCRPAPGCVSACRRGHQLPPEQQSGGGGGGGGGGAGWVVGGDVAGGAVGAGPAVRRRSRRGRARRAPVPDGAEGVRRSLRTRRRASPRAPGVAAAPDGTRPVAAVAPAGSGGAAPAGGDVVVVDGRGRAGERSWPPRRAPPAVRGGRRRAARRRRRGGQHADDPDHPGDAEPGRHRPAERGRVATPVRVAADGNWWRRGIRTRRGRGIPAWIGISAPEP